MAVLLNIGCCSCSCHWFEGVAMGGCLVKYCSKGIVMGSYLVKYWMLFFLQLPLV